MVRAETMAEEVSYVVGKYDYVAQGQQELSIKKSEKCVLLDGSKKWWRVQNLRGDAGYVPSNFMKRSKPSLLSSLRNTLGRRKGAEVAKSHLVSSHVGLRPVCVRHGHCFASV